MKHFKYIKKEVAIFEQLKNAYDCKVVPCSEAEVNELESMLPDSYYLPMAYKEFLLYGGHDMGRLFNSVDFSYEMTKIQLKNNYQDFHDMLQAYEEPNFKLPDNIFVINNHLCSNFTYFFLAEDENPPVYWWEEDEGNLQEGSKKDADSFSQFLMKMIEKTAGFSAHQFVVRRIDAGKPPRGQQFWIPEELEYSQGAKKGKLMRRLGFYGENMVQVKAICGVDTYPYLEELSGWKAIKVGDEVRFFPPSYESPEEKEKKVLELQNQIESKKQELASVEKTITNIQNRIKNLSGGKLTGGINFFDNPSASRIKELEKDLRKQKILKQNLEKEITQLEENSN